jgi:hypothetical protein
VRQLSSEQIQTSNQLTSTPVLQPTNPIAKLKHSKRTSADMKSQIAFFVAALLPFTLALPSEGGVLAARDTVKLNQYRTLDDWYASPIYHKVYANKVQQE